MSTETLNKPADAVSAANARYQNSQEFFERASKVVPLASQTFSKSAQQFPQGHAPLFASHGKAGRLWDIDGNEYIDFMSALAPVLLGYCDPDVDAAIKAQLEKGMVFSLASKLETELAERLIESIPCAEMVRFGKNGSDATLACVRIARAVTGRESVAVGGYHGWHDWYLASTTRDKGVPVREKGLIHKFAYNDIESLRKLLTENPGTFAAVIMEPMNVEEPYPGYLAEVKELTHKHGALLILDEIVTGFRFGLGGAQERFGVVPDMSAFGKAMGNGMPISAVVGRADLMAEMNEIFFSSTFGGESLSLAASIAVIDKMKREPVIDSIWSYGQKLIDGINDCASRHSLTDVVSTAGTPPWSFVVFKAHAEATQPVLKTLFAREMMARGVLTNGSHVLSYAHQDKDIDEALAVYDDVFGFIASELNKGSVESRLGCPPVEPVFKVRS